MENEWDLRGRVKIETKDRWGAVVQSRWWIEGRRSPTKASEMLEETHGVIVLIMSAS